MTTKTTPNKFASLFAGFAAAAAATVLTASHQAASQTPAPPTVAPVSAPKARVVPAAKNTGAAVIPYHSPAFSRFIYDSYQNAGMSQAQAKWYTAMDGAFQKSGVRYAGKEKITHLSALMEAVGRDYVRAKTPAQKTMLERKTAAFIHAMVKKSLPKFSLDRGFEFFQALQKGERQCYLQAVLVSGMMQKAGMNAGVVMVSKSATGQETNNGHCVALVKLADGHDILVDISHPAPFVAQQGLMVADAKTGAFRYVTPQYGANAVIVGYTAPGKGTPISLRSVRALDYPFLLSQFDYYRGERAPGGFVDAHKTPEGLENSARYLQKSIRECPQNPLAQYVLGRVYLRQNKMSEAAPQIATAYALYEKAGWVPQGAKEALALVKPIVKPKTHTLSMR